MGNDLSGSMPEGARPFGDGLRDLDLRVLVASADVRYRRRLDALVVFSASRPHSLPAVQLEMIIGNTPDNLAVLESVSQTLEVQGRMDEIPSDRITDILLVSRVTGESALVTVMPPDDFARIEAVSRLEQIHIGPDDEDHGSWVCGIIGVERLDALLGSRVVHIRTA